MSSDCVCKPRWSGNIEAYPAADLMLSVPGAIDAILDTGINGLTRYTVKMKGFEPLGSDAPEIPAKGMKS
jgi:hypothetical protein